MSWSLQFNYSTASSVFTSIKWVPRQKTVLQRRHLTWITEVWSSNTCGACMTLKSLPRRNILLDSSMVCLGRSRCHWVSLSLSCHPHLHCPESQPPCTCGPHCSEEQYTSLCMPERERRRRRRKGREKGERERERQRDRQTEREREQREGRSGGREREK